MIFILIYGCYVLAMLVLELASMSEGGRKTYCRLFQLWLTILAAALAAVLHSLGKV